MAFCPWCGKENPGANALCENCGGQLNPAPVQPVQPVQPEPMPQNPTPNPFASMPKVNTEAIGDFTKAAGAAFASVPKPQIQAGGYGFQYVISFLFPFFGFLYGAIMMASDNPAKVKVGKNSVIMAIIAMVISVIIGLIVIANC